MHQSSHTMHTVEEGPTGDLLGGRDLLFPNFQVSHLLPFLSITAVLSSQCAWDRLMSLCPQCCHLIIMRCLATPPHAWICSIKERSKWLRSTQIFLSHWPNCSQYPLHSPPPVAPSLQLRCLLDQSQLFGWPKSTWTMGRPDRIHRILVMPLFLITTPWPPHHRQLFLPSVFHVYKMK